MPVDMRLLIAEALVVELERRSDRADRLADREHLVEQFVRLAAGHQMGFDNVALGEEYAIAAIELRVAEDDPAARQLGYEIRKRAGLDPVDDRADAARPRRRIRRRHRAARARRGSARCANGSEDHLSYSACTAFRNRRCERRC